MTLLGHLVARLRGRPRHRVEISVPTLHLGSAYGGYVLSPTGLTPESVIYSFGVGEDISFDLGVIERFGATVHAFDPTPRSIEWVHAGTRPVRFRFHPFGVASRDGTARFTPPADPAHVSHSLLAGRRSPRPAVELEVHRLSWILESLGHDHLDLLKLDIEGAEYEVLEDLVASRIAVGQILVEFHHRIKGIGMGRTERTIDQLRATGYRIFHISADGSEFSFLGS